MANTECNYIEMVNGIKMAAKKIEEEVPLQGPQSIAVDIAMTTMIVLIDIASSFNRIAKALEKSGTTVNNVEPQESTKPKFPAV